MNQIKLLFQDREKCLNLLTSLGFIINKEKSNLFPKQKITYIGGSFHFDCAVVTPTLARIKKLVLAVKKICSDQNQAEDFLHLQGIIASCLELIPHAGIFMRPVQLHLLCFWKRSSQDLQALIPVIQHLKSHLQWWLVSANTMKGRSLHQAQTNITMTTDASMYGYGGHVGNHFIQGTWSEAPQKLHINYLELEAFFLTLKHFLPLLKNQNILVRCNNTTVVQYINKQGGTKSPQLCYRTWDLWKFAIQNNIHIRAAHILGVQNRMDSAQVCGPENFSALGLSLDSPICISSESPDTDILFLGSSSPCSSIGCIVNFMGENLHICPSSHLPNSQGPATYGSVSLSDNSNCTEMATQTLVHRSSAVLNSMSKEVTSYAESTSPAKQFNKSSKSRNFQSSCLATIDRSFQEKGFSSKSRKLLSAS